MGSISLLKNRTSELKVRPVIHLIVLIILLAGLIVTSFYNESQIKKLKEMSENTAKTQQELIQSQKDLENVVYSLMEETGLIAYWSFDSESTNDLKGNNHGVNLGAEYTQESKIGGAYIFNGAEKIKVSNPTKLDLKDTSATISAWIYTPDWSSMTSQYNGIITNYKETGPYEGYRLIINRVEVNGKITCSWNSGTYFVDSTSAIGNNEWYHIACVYDTSSQELRLYINGKLNNTKTDVPAITTEQTNDLCIGSSNNEQYWNGLIDEIKIWNRALAPEEIKRLAKRD
jgi:hypothetical protein